MNTNIGLGVSINRSSRSFAMSFFENWTKKVFSPMDLAACFMKSSPEVVDDLTG